MGNLNNYPEKNGVNCGNCQIRLPANNGKFHHIDSELYVFYSELIDVDVVIEGSNFFLKSNEARDEIRASEKKSKSSSNTNNLYETEGTYETFKTQEGHLDTERLALNNKLLRNY